MKLQEKNILSNLNYLKVETFVRESDRDLEVCSNFMDFGIQKPKRYITIYWNQFDSKELPTGKYITGKHKDTEEYFKLIAVSANSVRDRIVTLLHEYGHHTSSQSGAVVNDEINAWIDCFKWMEYLGIRLCSKVKELVSKCLGSYLDIYGHTSTVLSFYKKYNIPYKVNEDLTYLTLPQPK